MTAWLVADRALRDRRRGLGGWMVGIFVYVGLLASLYPSIRNSQIIRAVHDYPTELKAFVGGSLDFATGAGYLNAELFSLVVPAMLVIVAVGFGARTLAGEEQNGALDLLLANPITRRRVVFEKVSALVVIVTVLAAVVGAAVLLVGAFADLGIGIGNLAAACSGVALLAILMGLVAMFVGAMTGRRSVAIGTATAVFAVSYLITALAQLVSWIKPLKVLSPLYHANGTVPLRNGLPIANMAVLTAACVVVAIATSWAFQRRDLVHT